MEETPIYFYKFETTYEVLSGDGYTLDLYSGAVVGEAPPLSEVATDNDDVGEVLIFASGALNLSSVYLNFYIDSEVSNVNTHSKGFVIKAEAYSGTPSNDDVVTVFVWAFKAYAT